MPTPATKGKLGATNPTIISNRTINQTEETVNIIDERAESIQNQLSGDRRRSWNAFSCTTL